LATLVVVVAGGRFTGWQQCCVGVPAMSLINQMLQDLEQRSVGNMSGAGLHREVRAAPERRHLHPAWWLVLLLSVALIAVVLWLWLRPVPIAPVNPQLALKIAPDLAATPSPVAQAPLPMEADHPVAVANNPGHPADTQASVEIKSTANVQRDTNGAHDGNDNAPPSVSIPTQAAKVELPQPKPARPVKNDPPISMVSSSDTSNDDAKPIKLTKQIKELTPQQQAENAYRQAVTNLQSGRGADAMAGLEQALKLDPSHAGARQMLVGILLQSKRNDEAMQRAQEGLAIDPSQVGLTMILARIQIEQSDQKGALATLERGLPYANANAEYQAFFAALLQREKRNKEAIDHYVLALAKSPENSVWWMGLGISLQAENRLPEAKEAFNRAKTTNGLTPELLAFVNQKLNQLR
jgi:MSHA biogenesis protein MshN